jgi:hypothetical protein
MPHVTFIHGISNKPPPDVLSRAWRRTLAQHGLDLDDRGVSSEFVYWADLLYPAPLAETVLESAEDPEVADDPVPWAAVLPGEEAAFVAALAERIGYDEASAPVEVDDPAAEDPWERVPLPWAVKQRLMSRFLRDVHHYLFDAAFSPREGETYRIQSVIRERMVAALQRGAEREAPHVIVSHSLGTVIAYDCLKRVDGCPAVDSLLTIGSPLTIDEVQDRLKPGWTRSDGFPTERVRDRWVNVYDRWDPVVTLAPTLAGDYRRAEALVIDDIREQNWGKWRHAADKYLAGKRLRSELESMLDLAPPG